MTSKLKKSAKLPAKKAAPKKALKKIATATKKSVPKKITPTTVKNVARKPVVKKKLAVKKSSSLKKSIATKKVTPKKSTKKTVLAKVEKEVMPKSKPIIQPKLGGNNNGKLVEIVANNNSSIEQESNVEDNIINDLPVPDKNTRQGKFARKFDKHQIQISSVKKGGPKPSGKKPLW